MPQPGVSASPAPIYKLYDQAALDAQYNNRARVDNFDAVLDAWRQRSEVLRRQRPYLSDLAYGEHPRHRLDFFPAPTPRTSPPPLLVFLHGGYWIALDKTCFEFLAADLLDTGISVAFADYPLGPADDMDTISAAAYQAVRWLLDQAGRLGFDAHRLAVCGHSAGGHLVGMLLSSNWGSQPGPCAGMALSGLFDLEPIRRSFLGPLIGLTPEAVRRNSPILLDPALRCPLLLAVGSQEPAEYHAQSAALARAWGDRSSITSHCAASTDHFTVLETLLDARVSTSRLAATAVRESRQAHPATHCGRASRRIVRCFEP